MYVFAIDYLGWGTKGDRFSLFHDENFVGIAGSDIYIMKDADDTVSPVCQTSGKTKDLLLIAQVEPVSRFIKEKDSFVLIVNLSDDPGQLNPLLFASRERVIIAMAKLAHSGLFHRPLNYVKIVVGW